MKRFITLFAFLLIPLFAKDINIATYNVENLFDGVNQGSEYRDFRLGNNGWSQKMATIKLQNTAKAVKLIGADIVAVQEVENKNILKQLAKKTGFQYTAFAKPNRSPIGLGVLSKYPIKKSKNFKAGIEKTRDFLYTKIDINGHSLGLWVVHFPTQKYPKSQRKRVANHLKKAIKSQNDAEYIVVGDFNTKISRNSILQQSFGTFGVGKNLYDPWFSLPSSKRWSHSFFGKKSAIDRMLLSPGMFDGKNLDFKKGSFRVVKKDFLVNKKGYPNRWQMRGKKNSKKHLGKGYSDHLPLMLTLTTKPQNTAIKQVNIDELFKLPVGKIDLKLEKAVVIYKNKLGVVLGKDGRGIYIHRPGFNLKKFYMYDVAIKGLQDYQGRREIVALDVTKEHGKISNITPYYQKLKNFKKLRAGDVIDEVKGEVKGKRLITSYGKIPIFTRDKIKLADGEKLHLKGVRVGKFANKVELIIEETR